MLAGFLISPLVSMVYHSFEGDFKEILRNEKENFKFISFKLLFICAVIF
jgi:hypothetical protein